MNAGSQALEGRADFCDPVNLTDEILLVAEPTKKDDVAVLQDFVKTLGGGLAKHDFATDNDDARPLLVSAETDSDSELDVKLYTNIDLLCPHHLACHLPKAAGCPGCDMGRLPNPIRAVRRGRRSH